MNVNVSQAIHPLYDSDDLYTLGTPIEHGFYQREMPDGFRWIRKQAECYLRLDPTKIYEDPSLCIIAMEGRFEWRPYLSVEWNGKYITTEPIYGYREYFIPLDPAIVKQSQKKPVHLVLKVSHETKIHENLEHRFGSIVIYSISVIDISRDAFPERGLFYEQILPFSVNQHAYSPHLQKLRTDPSSYCLDIGAGMGWTTALLAAKTKGRVFGIDMHPYDNPADQTFKKQLQGRLLRHLCVLARTPDFEHITSSAALDDVVQNCTFITMDAEKLWFRDDFFDYIYSQNAFEHIMHPERALFEIRRVLKPNGEAFIHFHLPYYSDGGDHLNACKLLDEPWAILRFSREQIKIMIQERGKPTNEVDSILDSLNGLAVADYHRIFSTCGLQIIHQETHRGFTVPGSENSEAFAELKKIYPIEELTTIGFFFHLKKHGGKKLN